MSTEIMNRASIARMIEAYQAELEVIGAAYDSLQGAWDRLIMVAGSDQYRNRLCPLSKTDYYGEQQDMARRETAKVEEKIRRAIWRMIIDRINPWPWLTELKHRELTEWLGGDLPALTVDEVLAIVTAWQQNREQALMDLARETYNFLRPYRHDPRVTAEKNRGYRLGKKVILTGGAVGPTWAGGLEAGTYKREGLNRLDAMFHLLDGEPYPDTYNGPLVMAIEGKASGEKFRTAYFECKGYSGAGTLHITFLRRDLVRQLEALANDGRTLSQNR